MPRFTTSVIALPVCPFHPPERTRSTNDFIRLSTAFTSGMTSAPSTWMGVFERLRRATWRTARFSVRLIFSPPNIALASVFTPAASTRASSSARVSSVTMFLE